MSEPREPVFDQENNPDDFDGAVNIANSAAERARALIDKDHLDFGQQADPNHSTTPSEKPKKPHYGVRRAGVALAITAAAVGAGKAGAEIVDYLNGPEISDKTIEHVIQPGERAWDILDQIDGIEEVNKQDVLFEIAKLPGNESISFSNLQPGDVIILPESVET